MDWGKNSKNLISVGQDGRLIEWDALNALKSSAILLPSVYVMCCAYSPSLEYAATGGLDNVITIFSMKDKENIHMVKELVGHEGFVGSIRYLGDEKVVTASGDKTCKLWDIGQGLTVSTFGGHTADVMCTAISPSDPSLFVSGSIDKTAKLWDIRTSSCAITFEGHQGDINALDFFPNGFAFVTAADDATSRLFDIRTQGELMKYTKDNIWCGLTSVAFSKGGKFLFQGRDDFKICVWDTLKGELTGLLDTVNKVSCLGVSPNGMALCSGNWDSHLTIWA